MCQVIYVELKWFCDGFQNVFFFANLNLTSRSAISMFSNNQTTLNEDFRKFFGDKIVVFESGLPQCKPDDVLVEYHSLVHKLKFYESSLIITQTSTYGPDVINQDSYCIENSLNSEVSVPDGADPNQHLLKATSKWIAKACRPKTVCNRMPCVRKCCKEGQRMVNENKTSFCEAHDSHLALKFHFFDIRESPEQPNPMEPTGKFAYLGGKPLNV